MGSSPAAPLAELLLPAAVLLAAHLFMAVQSGELPIPSSLGMLSMAFLAILARLLLFPEAQREKAVSATRAERVAEEAFVDPLPVEEHKSARRRAWWIQCFPFLDRKPSRPKSGESGSQKGREEGGDCSEASVHPKFCGLRLEEGASAGALPSLAPFAAEPLGSPCPDDWEPLLSHRDDERALCRKLREAVFATEGPKDPLTMLRFLRARRGNIDRAAEMYRKAMETRLRPGYERGFRSGELDDAIHRRLDPYWKPLGLLGFDRDGDPVLWSRIGLTPGPVLGRLPIGFIIKHEAYFFTRVQQAMEEMMHRLGRPIVYFTVVEDLTGLGIQHLNRRGLQNYQAVVRYCEDNYPEMVKRALVIKAPGIFARIWSLVKHFFDEGTREKIQIVGGSETYETLSRFVEPRWIPECYGGQLRIGGNCCCEPVLPRPVAGIPEDILQEVIHTWEASLPAACREDACNDKL